MDIDIMLSKRVGGGDSEGDKVGNLAEGNRIVVSAFVGGRVGGSVGLLVGRVVACGIESLVAFRVGGLVGHRVGSLVKFITACDVGLGVG